MIFQYLAGSKSIAMAPVHSLKTFYSITNTPAPFAGEETGHFLVLPVEDLLLPADRPRNLARRSYFKVSIVTGHSLLHFPATTLEAKGTVLTFTNPLTPYGWEVQGPQSGYVCVFTEDFLQQQLELRGLPMYASIQHSLLELDRPQTVFFTQLFERILAEHQGDFPFRRTLIRSLLIAIILEAQKLVPLDAAAPTNSSNAYERITSRFFDLLQQQYVYTADAPARTAQAFASALHVHVNHLNKVLRTVTGKTTSEWIQQKMLEEAILLLKNNTATINEIAWSLGFEQANHFSTFFKRHTGKTPQQFKLDS